MLEKAGDVWSKHLAPKEDRTCCSTVPRSFVGADRHAVTLFGMAGVGKTRLSALLRERQLVPLFGRLPHRHALYGRVHRRQFQARGDEGAVPAGPVDLGLDLHLVQHHLPQSRSALDLSRHARRSRARRPALCRISAPPGTAPRRRDRRASGRALFHRAGRGALRLHRFRLRHRRIADRGGRSRTMPTIR